MSVSIGGLLRSLVARGLAEGLPYNDLYRAVSEAGVSVTSSVFASEYRYSVGLSQGFVDFRGGRGAAVAGDVPTADTITAAPVSWPDRYNVRVQLRGRDLSTGQFSSRWLNIGYSRLPTYGTIADTALTLAVLGTDHYEFDPSGVAGVTVEESADWQQVD